MTFEERPRLDVKVQELTARLRELALQKGPDVRLPTTRELCTLLKTNSATLNEALKELEQHNVIYRKPKSGIFVSPKLYRKTICVLFFSRLFFSDTLSPFWSMLWAQFGQEMKRRNAAGKEYYSFHLVPEPLDKQRDLLPEELPESVLEMLHDRRVHGVLAVGMEMHVYNWLIQQEIPSVTFAGVGSLMLNIYNESTVHMVIDNMVAQGCRAIGVWIPAIGSIDDYKQNTAYKGWQQQLTRSGLPVQEELFRWGEPLAFSRGYDMYDFQKQGYELAYSVFGTSGAPRPDGIFITNDLMTNGALAALDELGITIGTDVKIVTMANAGSPMLANAKAQSLTLVEVDVAELIQRMFSLMEKAINEHSISDMQMYYLTPQLQHVERSVLPNR